MYPRARERLESGLLVKIDSTYPDGTELPDLLKPASTSGGVLRHCGRRRRQSGEPFVDSCTVAYLMENVDLATTLLLDVTKVILRC